MDSTPELHDLSSIELIQLAMLAFMHMDKEGELTKEELLDQILLWFSAMTFDIVKDKRETD